MIENDILKDLNSEQKEAVTHTDGPLLIVAGAGTGKTTVITRRLAWLIFTQRAKAEEILTLTFTDKAAEEMEERVDRLLPYGYVDLWISTFHSFGERILKDNAFEIGLNPNFKLLTPVDAWQLIRKNLKEFKLDYYRPLGSPTRFIQALVQHFSRLKDENVKPDEYLNLARKKLSLAKNEIEEEEAKKLIEVASAFKTYEEIKERDGFLDFGDLIVKTLELFQKRPAILERYRKQFKYILVDEFQDTNWAQYELLKLLAAPKNNLTVTGDDDQALYRWRGAAYTNLIQFYRDYPEAKIVVLKENYRNKQNILDLSYQFIQLNNPDRLESQLAKNPIKGIILTKKLKTVREGDGIIQLLRFKTQEEEAEEVVRKIIEIKKENRELNWSDFAILVRANAHADLFIRKLSQLEVPYQFVASRGLYRQPEIMDLISFLKLLDNYHESVALYRFISLPIFKFDPLDLMNLMHYSRRKNLSLFETLEKSDLLSIKPETRKEISKILNLLRKFTELSKKKTVGQILYQFIDESGLLKVWTEKDDQETYNRIANLRTFFKKIEEFERLSDDKTIKGFIDQINLEIEAGEEGPLESLIEEGPDAVKVMTVHQAKGLEFRYVFIVNLVDRRFPSIEKREPIEIPTELIKEIIPEGDSHLQEERRIFYVAMTRAKDGLFFCLAEDYGGTRKKKPSRFLQELGIIKDSESIKGQQQIKLLIPKVDEELLLERKNIEVLPAKFSYTQLKAFEICPKQYKYAHILQIPRHPKFNFSFGHTIHNTLRDFYRIFKERKTPPSLEELLEIYERNWIDEWYESKEHELEMKENGRKSLIEFYKIHQNKFKIPKFIEKEFNIKIGNYTIKGVIDRVDVLDVCQTIPSDKVEIIDYKTGQIPKNEEDLDLDQLLIYALAVKEVFHDLPVRLTYYFIEENKPISIENFSEDLVKIKEKIIETIEKIFKSDFKATPNPWKCKNCDFREICEDRQL